MTTLNPDISMLASIPTPVKTKGANRSELASESQREDQWQEIIDKRLIEWGKNSVVFDEEEFIVPTSNSIKLACIVAMNCRDQKRLPPLRVLPDGEGGIVFERQENDVFETIEVDQFGNIEICTYIKCKLVYRNTFPASDFE